MRQILLREVIEGPYLFQVERRRSENGKCFLGEFHLVSFHVALFQSINLKGGK